MTKSKTARQMFYAIGMTVVLLYLPRAVDAQNAITHYITSSSTGAAAETDNKSIDYITGMQWGDGYLLSGKVLPNNIGGYNNVGPIFTIPRFQLLATDANNQTQWVKTYVEGVEISGICQTLSIAFTVSDAKQTSDGGFIVCGHAYKTGDVSSCIGIADFSEPFLLKTDKNGIPQWYRRYTVSGLSFSSVVEDSTNPNGYRYIVCGTLVDKAFYMFTNATGVPQTSGMQEEISMYSEVAICDVGGNRYYSFTGNMKGATQQVDGYRLLLTTIDQNNNIIINKKYDLGGIWWWNAFGWEWQYRAHSFSGTGINDAYDGTHVVICGNTLLWYLVPGGVNQQPDAIIMKADPLNGNITWNWRYLEPEFVSAFIAKSISAKRTEEQIAITGYRYELDTLGAPITTGAFYLETDPNGNVNREVTYSGDLAFEGIGIVRNASSNYFAYSGNVKDYSYAIRNNYGNDCDPDQEVWMKNIEADIIDVGMQGVQVNSQAYQIVSFNLPFADNLVCGQLKPAPTHTNNLASATQFSIVPNPSSGTASLEFSGLPSYKQGVVKVTDMLGRTVFQKEMDDSKQEGRVQLDLPNHLPSGQYVVSMYCDGAQVTVQRLSLVR